MDTSIEALQEALAISRQIDALEKRLSLILEGATPVRKKGKRTPAGRKKLSQLTKSRPAARLGGLTPAGRIRLSELMKARWAARRKPRRGKGSNTTGPLKFPMRSL